MSVNPESATILGGQNNEGGRRDVRVRHLGKVEEGINTAVQLILANLGLPAGSVSEQKFEITGQLPLSICNAN